MNKKMSKRQRDLKTKLMAAICMLLVSSIMMVSTTYAWFTLSTAPEVTGITTAVGANGNLEMALLPKSGNVADITSQAGDSVKDAEDRNVTWGNLVDLSDTTVYGLDKITLFPSALNAATEDSNKNPLTLATSMLKTPTYGADGRVSELLPNTFTGYYNSQNGTFTPDNQYGVRAVGTASGMTDRQLDYRNARSAANTATAQAANQASQSLNSNGSALANIAIKYGMDSTGATFGTEDVASLRAIIDDLKGAGGVLDRIETAYLQYILAYGASAASGEDDTAWSGVKGLVNASDATLDSVIEGLATYGVTLPDALETAVEKYEDTVDAVATADTKLQALESSGSADFTWEQIKEAMTPLANPAAMKINGFLASEVKANLGALVSSVTQQGGLKVIMATGAGVYADIADQCGNYNASINIAKVEYNGIVLENMSARMETATTVNPVYLVAIGAAVENAKAPGGGAAGSLPISDMYGYIIDMAFRTNAAESNLLLQVEAADRIYTDNTNEQTMGHGSSMTFKATTTDFSDNQVKELMDAIRIVFFDKGTMKVIATAKLDTANATYGTDGWTAKMYMYTKGSGTGTTYAETTYDPTATDVTYYIKTAVDVYTVATNPSEGAELYTMVSEGTYTQATYDPDASDVTYYTKSTQDKYTALTSEEAENSEDTLYVANTANGTEVRDNTNAIMPLTQNTAHALSALVYLDGENVTNADVAATANTSMTGKMSLQFASSANLVPMEYAALYQGSGNNTNGGTPETTEATTAPTETPVGG